MFLYCIETSQRVPKIKPLYNYMQKNLMSFDHQTIFLPPDRSETKTA